jgi:hypothetical protein
VTPVARWLLHLADPEGPRRAPPRRKPSHAELRALLLEAEMHGVLAPVLHNAARERLLTGAAAIEAEAVARRNAATGFSLMLRQRAERVMRRARAAGIRATIVKGPVSADRLYAERVSSAPADSGYSLPRRSTISGMPRVPSQSFQIKVAVSFRYVARFPERS